MEAFTIFLLVVVGMFALIGIPAVFFMVGLYASPDGKKPPMTMRIIDYSGLRHGGSVRTRFIKYHPKTAHYATPYDNPMAHGLVRVIEKRGLFGMRNEEITWEAGRIQLPADKKHGYGTYCADLLQLEMQERLDGLSYKNKELRLKLNETENQLQFITRNADERLEELKSQYVKDLAKMNVMMASRKRSGGDR